MHAIRHALLKYAADKPRVELTADRHVLAKVRWRGTARDGTEFGFDLAHPLADGDIIFESAAAVYVVRQAPEAVLETVPGLALAQLCAAAWTVGNLHQAVQVLADRIRMPAEDSLRRVFHEQGIPLAECQAVFQPQRSGHRHV